MDGPMFLYRQFRGRWLGKRGQGTLGSEILDLGTSASREIHQNMIVDVYFIYDHCIRELVCFSLKARETSEWEELAVWCIS